jgi:predicted RNA-binding protein with PIN domain
MLILIDGYNLIRQSDNLRRYERKSLEAGRKALITKLVEYEKKKTHSITVVFDGVQNGGADEGRDREGKINIIYSRHGERADDVIKRIAAQAIGDIIVVSSDREISSYVTSLGKTPLTSPEFEIIVNKAILSSPRPTAVVQKNEIHERKTKKKGPSKRLPRAKRKAQIKIEKL